MLLCRFKLLPPALDRVAGPGQSAQHRRHVRLIAQLKPHIAGVTGRSRPEVGMTQRVRNRTVPAGTLTEHAAAAAATASEAPLDLRHHALQQETPPRAGGSRVDVLVAAETGETIGKSDANQRHRAFADQPIEPLRQVLAKA